MPFSFLPFFRKFRKKPKRTPVTQHPVTQHPVTQHIVQTMDVPTLTNTPIKTSSSHDIVCRHFFNEPGFQTYGSFFEHWDGHITAGHVVSECGDKVPPFSQGSVESWPAALDAALIGCTLPDTCPQPPHSGQDVICVGFPAGSAQHAIREAVVYIERPGTPDTWIARITTPDEPVVTGMSGGAVIDAKTGEPLGILITRNSPADLNNDRDPDESFDFVALSGVWNAVNRERYV
ncbi:MAG: hypothetical protein COA43_12755 [Robiginitomaculum sp.]|nr:MAG: hypothetical protein COA43_12755 [Robiginitomaculum sp.]